MTAWTVALIAGAVLGVGGLVALVRFVVIALTRTTRPRHRRR